MPQRTRLASGLAAYVLVSAIYMCSNFAAAYSAEYSGTSGVTNGPLLSGTDKMLAYAQAQAVKQQNSREDDWKKIPIRNEPKASLQEIAGWKIIGHVTLQSELNSANCKGGDIVWGLLDDDLKWGSKLIAARNSL